MLEYIGRHLVIPYCGSSVLPKIPTAEKTFQDCKKTFRLAVSLLKDSSTWQFVEWT